VLPLLLLLAAPCCVAAFAACSQSVTSTAARSASTPSPRMMAGDGRRRPSRVGMVVQAELATLIRTGDIHGSQKIPGGLKQLISIVDVDMSPDLRNARIKVSVIGDRKDKVSAVRWLRANNKGLRHALAKKNRGMKRIPQLSFDHVDVGAATDMMIKLEELKRGDEAAQAARGEGDEDMEGGFDFAADDEDAWLDDDDDADDDAWLDDDDDDDTMHHDDDDVM